MNQGCRSSSARVGYVRLGMLLMIFGGLACTRPAGRTDGQRPFVIVMLPDTQNYLQKWPESFMAQTDWIGRNRERENIAFVTHIGDVVNDPNGSKEWEAADKAMSQLDGVVPWGVCLGNHDYHDHGESRVATGFLQHFGPQRFRKYPWYGGASDNGLNSYQLFSAGGIDFVALHLELDVPDPAIAWAIQVLAKHSSRAAIVSTHSYLHGLDGIGREKSAENVWNKLIRSHPQIFMVLCGHITDAVEYHQISVNDAGNKVLEMLADYQKRDHGGDGWLRLIRIVPASHEIQVRTYSPVLDKWETDADSQFVAPLVLPAQCQPRPGRVQADVTSSGDPTAIARAY